MPIEFVDVDEAIEDSGLKTLVYGRAGAGKTVLCTTTGGTTTILSAENGLLSLKLLKKQYPEVFKKIKIVKISSIEDLEEAYEFFSESEEQVCDWICIDSASEIAEQILSDAKKECNDPRKAYGIMQERVSDAMRNFRDLPGYNVLMLAKMERVVDEDTGKTMYRPMLPGKRLPQEIPFWFDEVFCLRVEEDEEGNDYRVLQTGADYRYDAKDRSGTLDMFEKPSMKAILNKMEKVYAEAEEEANSEAEAKASSSEEKPKKTKKEKKQEVEKAEKKTEETEETTEE